MSKTTLRNVNASVEVRELKDELRDGELGQISGGLVVPSIIAVLIGPLHTPVKEPAPAKHWFNGG